MKKKTVIIILVAVFVLIILPLCAICLFCTLISSGGFAYLFNEFSREAIEIKNEKLPEICESHGDFDEDDYEDWFTKNFRISESYEDTQELIEDMFPKDYDCDELYTESLFDLFTNGQSFSFETRNGVTTGTFTFKDANDDIVEVVFIEKGSKWQINSISQTFD